MHTGDAATLHNQVLRKLRAGEEVAAVAAGSGISPSTVYR